MLKTIHILVLKNKLMIKILNLKLVITEEFLSIKIFLLKGTHQIGLKRLLLLVKLKIHFHEHMLLMILMVKKSLEYFMKKNCKRLIKTVIKRKGDKLYVKWKGYDNSFNSGIDEKDLV